MGSVGVWDPVGVEGVAAGRGSSGVRGRRGEGVTEEEGVWEDLAVRAGEKKNREW